MTHPTLYSLVPNAPCGSTRALPHRRKEVLLKLRLQLGRVTMIDVVAMTTLLVGNHEY